MKLYKINGISRAEKHFNILYKELIGWISQIWHCRRKSNELGDIAMKFFQTKAVKKKTGKKKWIEPQWPVGQCQTHQNYVIRI